MKKLLISFFALLSLNSFAQRWQTITGNGEVKKETRETGAFTSLFSGGAMNVEVAYGKSNQISLEADENLLPYIETSVENGKLTIKPKKNVNLKSRSKMVVYVSMTTITSLQLSGSGNIDADGNFTNDGKTIISISGSGNIKLNFSSFKDLDLSITGSGNMNLKNGTTNTIDAKVSGSGNIDGSNITSNNVDAKISGSGNVYYKGNVSNISSKIAGSGKVIKI